MLKIDAQERDVSRSPKQLRKEGLLPVVMYGAGTQARPLAVDQREFMKVWEQAGETSVITVVTPTDSKMALIHEVQRDPVSNKPIHADLYVVEKGKRVETHVPLVLTGVAPVVKAQGGILVSVVRELTVEADAQKIPHEIAVDVSGLDSFDSQILAKDIPLPEGVTLAMDPEEVVVAVSEPTEEEEGESGSIADIEVEARGKTDE